MRLVAGFGVCVAALGCGEPSKPHRPDDAVVEVDSAEPAADSDDTSGLADSAEPIDSADTSDTAPPDDSADTALPPGCLDGAVTVDQHAVSTVDGVLGTNDGMSGHMVVGMQPSGTDAWVLGRTAATPGGRPTGGAIVRYPGLGAPDAWLGLDPEEGELELLAVGDVDGTVGDDLVVAIEHPGLVGARVVVHGGGWTSGSALDAAVTFVSDANGASPVPIAGDTDGDGHDDLHIGWADHVDRWVGPLDTGARVAGDGDQSIAGSLRQWGQSADVNGDGYADLVSATYDGVVVLFGGATGLSGTPDDPDHRFSGPSDAGADLGGIAVGADASGQVLLALTQVAEREEEPVVVVEVGVSGVSTSVAIGETGRVAATWAELDGTPGDELVLGRVPSATTDGGLWVFDTLDSEPMRVSAESSRGVVGALFAAVPEASGLVVLDPWGAAERQARLYVWRPCE